MVQCISKAAVVAMIKHHIKEEPHSYFCKCLLSEINTLETKEIDWDALAILAEHLIACEAHGVTPKYNDREIDMLEKLRKQ